MSVSNVGGYKELADFLQRLKTERRLSPHTVTAYQRDLNALLGFCEREQVESLAALDSYHVRRFAAESHRRGLGARSVARRLSACARSSKISSRSAP
jgi:integrase/recombinase XerC